MTSNKLNDRELYGYNGDKAQLYSVRRLKIMEGKASGANIVQVCTARGLELEITPDNGLDVSVARYNGVNMSYISKNGVTNGFNPLEGEFSNCFPGGMLYTCGLRNVGPGNNDSDEWFPLHGRIHGERAGEVCASVEGDNIIVSGVLTESSLFGHLFRLKRKITTPVWASEFTVEDTIENLTPNTQEIMVLYHYNFGYPLLCEDTVLEIPTQVKTIPRNSEAEKGLGKQLGFTKPADNEPEQVFFHETETGEARVVNKSLGIAATLTWDKVALPVLAEWKSMASGDYALGLEPTNCFIMGRSVEREGGTLKTLGAFKTMKTKTTLKFEALK
jgi:hypothetical protein